MHKSSDFAPEAKLPLLREWHVAHSDWPVLFPYSGWGGWGGLPTIRICLSKAKAGTLSWRTNSCDPCNWQSPGDTSKASSACILLYQHDQADLSGRVTVSFSPLGIWSASEGSKISMWIRLNRSYSWWWVWQPQLSWRLLPVLVSFLCLEDPHGYWSRLQTNASQGEKSTSPSPKTTLLSSWSAFMFLARDQIYPSLMVETYFQSGNLTYLVTLPAGSNIRTWL